MGDLHWPEYAIEASLLGTFMVCACVAVALFEHPSSTIRGRVQSVILRRAMVGMLMGLTAVALIYSPPGQRSGAHMNPGTTLTFLLLGKVRLLDAAFFVFAQFAGAFTGVFIARALLRRFVSHESVNFAATLPGVSGLRAAWIAEFTIAFLMMSMVLWSSNYSPTAPYTGVFAGIMVAAFIAIEAPYSGMSMNPARTLGSALHARNFRGLWIYFTAPPLAMLIAALLYIGVRGQQRVFCAKLQHPHAAPCIFDCHIEEMPGWTMTRSSTAGISRSSSR